MQAEILSTISNFLKKKHTLERECAFVNMHKIRRALLSKNTKHKFFEDIKFLLPVEK
jgi:hypothetical protein